MEPAAAPAMFDRFSGPAREAFIAARRMAIKTRSEFITPEHLLLGLIEADVPGIALYVLSSTQFPLKEMSTTVLQKIGTGNNPWAAESSLPFSSETRSIIGWAIIEAQSRECDFVGTQHLLSGMLLMENIPVATTLSSFGVTLQAIHERTVEAAKLTIVERYESHVNRHRQTHLSTAMVMMFVAGLMLWPFAPGLGALFRHASFGSSEFELAIAGTFSLLLAIYLLLQQVRQFCEWLISILRRRRLRRNFSRLTLRL